jgi:hypothetical protein
MQLGNAVEYSLFLLLATPTEQDIIATTDPVVAATSRANVCNLTQQLKTTYQVSRGAKHVLTCILRSPLSSVALDTQQALVGCVPTLLWLRVYLHHQLTGVGVCTLLAGDAVRRRGGQE